jgi:hypothetical protein
MKKLLDNQEIRIDNHHPATPLDWQKDDIHLHKRSLGKRKNDDRYYDIRVSLNRQWTCSQNNIPDKLREEIKECFENSQKREQFVKDITSSLNDLYDRKLTKFQRINQAMGNIRKAFDLSYPRAEIKGWIRKSLKMYISIHEDKNRYYYCSYINGSFYLGELSAISLLDYIEKVKTEFDEKIRIEIG